MISAESNIQKPGKGENERLSRSFSPFPGF
jgi:hypothetical protein